MISASTDAGSSLARTASIEAMSGRRTGEIDDMELTLFSRRSFARLSLVRYPPHAHETDEESGSQLPTTACAEESGLQCHGSPDLCWAVSFGAKYHQGADDREARYRHPLAACRFQIVFALEMPEPRRPTNCTVGNSRADPRDEHRRPVVGSAENPRGSFSSSAS